MKKQPSPSPQSTNPETDAQAWETFCDELKAAGSIISRPDLPTDALDRAEGFRYLSRLARLALEKFVEHDDPALPSFYRLSHETAKIGCDNPDSYYQNAAISGDHEYRLHGRVGTVAYLGIGAYYGHYGSDARSGCSGYLERGDLEIAPDGTFEVFLSRRPTEGNWLRMEEDSSMLIVRQNFLDRANETLGDLHLERTDGTVEALPLRAETLAHNLSQAARFVAGTAQLFTGWSQGFAKHPNELRAMDPAVTGGAHGDPNIFFYMGYWDLKPDQALVVHLTPPTCEYWNFQLNNLWMESLDYRYHPVHVNKHTARYEDDGSVRLIVAANDPGTGNWIDTAGHRHGTMGLRWVKAKDHPQPECRVVRLDSI